MNRDLELTILGSNSALPAHGRNPSCQYLNLNQEHVLIDCGEGAQKTMGSLKIPRSKINNIFISHLHGDHYFGLPGLLNSFVLQGRKNKLTIYSPPGLQGIMDGIFKVGGSSPTYIIEYIDIELDRKKKIYESSQIIVEAFPLEHRIACYGFRFEEKNDIVNLDGAKLNELKVPNEWRAKIAKGSDYIDPNNGLIKNSFFSLPKSPSRSYAYVTDTIYLPQLAELLRNTDLLYHESTFEHALLDRARFSYHTTAIQAATLAKSMNVKYLLLGHFSSRYRSTEILSDEARTVFPESYCVVESRKYRLVYDGQELKMLITN